MQIKNVTLGLSDIRCENFMACSRHIFLCKNKKNEKRFFLIIIIIIKEKSKESKTFALRSDLSDVQKGQSSEKTLFATFSRTDLLNAQGPTSCVLRSDLSDV